MMDEDTGAGDERMSADSMDEKRKQQIAYEYLCHLEEARIWLEACLKEELPPTTELEESLRNGVALAKLANFFAPAVVPARKIYDRDLKRYEEKGLVFRHTDNINHFFAAMDNVGLPKVFFPETTDVYDRKNMPRAIYCIHALSLYLHKLGVAPMIQDLYGKAEFTAEEITSMMLALEKYGIQMPTFSKIGGILANELSEGDAEMHAAIVALNSALEKNNQKEFEAHVVNPAAKLADLNFNWFTNYFTALQKGHTDKALASSSAEDGDFYDRNLTQSEIQAVISRMNSQCLVDMIIRSLQSKNVGSFEDAFSYPNIPFTHVDRNNMNRYFTYLLEKMDELSTASFDRDVDLDKDMIQAGIISVNKLVLEEQKLIDALHKINDAIDSQSADLTEFMKNKDARLLNVHSKLGPLYSLLLNQAKQRKIEVMDDPHAVLHMDEIQACIDKGNALEEDALRVHSGIKAVDVAVQNMNVTALMDALQSKNLTLKSVTEECGDMYLQEMRAARSKRVSQGDLKGWVEIKLPQGLSCFCKDLTGAFVWSRPSDFQPETGCLNREEIQGIVSKVTVEHDRELYLKANEASAVRIQAAWKGLKTRREYKEKLYHKNVLLPAVVKIQSWLRGRRQYQKYRERKQELLDATQSVIKIQSLLRMWLCRRHFLSRVKFIKSHVDDIIKIQSFLRANQAHQDYKNLVLMQNPPFKVVRKFVHLLEIDSNDFVEEIELNKLKELVVTEIRSQRELEQDLNQMDIKIGLLVKNRINLQEVVSHGKKLKRVKDSTEAGGKSGIKSLSKEKRVLLEGYQHLFYLLQTNPSYLAKLLLLVPQSKTTKFMETIVYTLFNYGQNIREEYLLLKLFENAIREEVGTKVSAIQDFITGNPMVVKLVITVYRAPRAQSVLSDILKSLVNEVINDKTLYVNLTPVEIYKQWVNKMETESGQTSNLPYDVDTEQALKHPEVQEKVDLSLRNIKRLCSRFTDTITRSADKLPYGFRHAARILHLALLERFPDSHEEIIKVVGNLVYYRYMNPVIAAPDSFNIVDVVGDKTMSVDQRRNLASIARILQLAAANKSFTGEQSYLGGINDFIQESWQKFRKYFLEVCTVMDAESYFDVDQFSDFASLTKPQIFISLQEMIDTHQLINDHLDILVNEPSDPLKLVMNDLPVVPTLEELVGGHGADESAASGKGKAGEPESDKGNLSLAHTTVCLVLTSKFEIKDKDASIEASFARTKKMIVDIIRVQPGDSLKNILNSPTTLEQEEDHKAWLKKIDTIKDNNTEYNAEFQSEDYGLTIAEKKAKVLSSLKALEAKGKVSLNNDYQGIIDAIAKDVRNQRRYRQRRKQEIIRLKKTLDNLNKKNDYFEKQSEFYSQYIKSCMDSLILSKKSKKKGKDKGKFVPRSFKFTGQKLYDKGVILEIEGVSQSQFKTVTFEISNTEDIGMFEVTAKAMGVEMEKVALKLEDLLQCQYEGRTVMKMFDKAKINVNLLIYLINQKFYNVSK